MKRSWAADALALIDAEGAAAMVTLAGVEGSAPREAGTKMVVGREAIFGTVGGGNLEHLLIDQARRLMARDDIAVAQQDYPLGPLLAQCCGGRVRVLIERLGAESREWLKAVDAVERAGERYTLDGRVADGRIARSIACWAGGDIAGVDLLNASGIEAGPKGEWTRIVERIAPVATALYLFGAGHVGKAVAHIAETLPFRFTWLDAREDMGENVEVRADLVAAAADAPAGAFHLVITHSHELDYQLVRAILRRGDAAFCGLIGSATKRARFISRLKKDGIDTSGLTCPIGAGAIRSKAPASIAVAVAAELLVRLEALESARADQRPVKRAGRFSTK